MSTVAALTDLEKAPIVPVVHNEPPICMLASDHVRDSGYQTLEAHNARRAIDLLEKGETSSSQMFECRNGGI